MEGDREKHVFNLGFPWRFSAQGGVGNGKIAFTSDRDGDLEIYVMNKDGTGQVVNINI